MELHYSNSNENSLTLPDAGREICQSTSAPSSPTKAPLSFADMMNKKSKGDDTGQKRTVKFPEDHSIVSGYQDAPDPFQFAPEDHEQDLESIAMAFKDACEKQNIEPIPSVLEQIKNFKSIRLRAQDLILRGHKLDAHQCEALEEILKRVLFRLIDLDSCDLDCDGASALFDMIEFYESASHLSIANNKSIGVIGWQALCRTLKKTSCLQYLDLSNTGLNEQILLFMGRTIRVGSHLVTLHLENAGLFGRRLAILVSSIKFNTSLRELYLGENKIGGADCIQLGNLLRGNSHLNVLDLRNNFCQDTGLDHICEGLAHQPPIPGATTTTTDIFHDSGCRKSSKPTLTQNNGILIINLSNNQLTSRAMNRLAQTLGHCRSLIGLDLSHNSLGDEGVYILKEGLLQCKTIKYLDLSHTDITSEGAKAIADVIRHGVSLTMIDLSNNDIGNDGVSHILKAVTENKRINKLVIIPQNDFHVPPTSETDDDLRNLVDQIDSYCVQNRQNASYDEFDSILNGFLRNDISVYQEIENDIQANKENNNLFSCDINENENETEEEMGNNTGSKKPLLARTASLGSWERPVKSGRFSVSPVGTNPVDEDVEIRDGGGGPCIQIDMVPTECTNAPTTMMDDRSSEEEDEASDLSEQETDQLPDLPSRGAILKNRLVVPTRSFRRMSSPVISVTGVKPKPKPQMQLKLSGNLESLDLKSSLPLSPTFFAKFDFSDISMLRLPADVEEIVSNLNLSDSESDLIFQFENFCRDKPSKQQHHQQCVY